MARSIMLRGRFDKVGAGRLVRLHGSSTIWVVGRGMRRPVRVRDRWAVIVGSYVAAALVGGLLVFTGLPSDLCATASTVLCIMASPVVVSLVPINGSVFGVIGGVLAALVFAFTLPSGIQTATLALRGS